MIFTLNYYIRTLTGLVVLLCLIIIPACDAPRINPYDPYNNESKIVYLEGTLRDYKSDPVAEAIITWQSEITQYSDQNGFFFFEKLEKKDGWLTFERYGYFKDSIYIQWEGEQKRNVEFVLNAKPRTDQLLYYSSVQNRINANSLDNIYIRTKIVDPDDGIDSVYLTMEGLRIKDLSFNISSKYFEANINANDLNTGSIDNTIGKEINLLVVDSRNITTNVETLKMKRVIRSEVELESPVNNDSVDLPILFHWKPYTPNFKFSYLLQIYTNEIETQLISQKAFSSSYQNYLFETYIPPGNYYWVLWSIDEYSNRSRSKPAGFILK